MVTIRLTGHVDENGRVEILERVDLPPGDVTIVIEGHFDENNDPDDAFDALIASPRSLAFLEKLEESLLAEIAAGLTDELDPDNL